MPTSDDALTAAMQVLNRRVAQVNRRLVWLTAAGALAASVVATALVLRDQAPISGARQIKAAGIVAGLVFTCTLCSVLVIGSAITTWAVRRLQRQDAARLADHLGIPRDTLAELTIPYGGDLEGAPGKGGSWRRKPIVRAVAGALGVVVAIAVGGSAAQLILCVIVALLPVVGTLEYYRRYTPSGAGVGAWTRY